MDIYERVISGLNESGGRVFSIGSSVCGLSIPCVHIGSESGKQVIITSAIHARECYTALVTLRQIEMLGYEPIEGDIGFYFVPLVNPDGALFFDRGETFGHPMLERNIERRFEWKANADGVDLNCNFDAEWGSGILNKREPDAAGYVGASPLSAPESAALVKLTQKVKPAATVSYHCMGGELYWEFFQRGFRSRRDKAFATAIAKEIGVRRVDGTLGSAGGYKDYCVQALGIPAVTIELIAEGSHPFRPIDFAEPAQKNGRLPKLIAELLSKM